VSEAQFIQPAGWPRPRGYSNAVSARGRIVSIAGQIGWDPRTHIIEVDDFVDQARQALLNIVAVLEAAEAAPNDVVRLTWYVTDREDYVYNTNALGRVYREVFGDHYPAMSVVVVAGLLEEKARVEIEATAVLAD
jgi:enamine deaminase RidA (YjgF/YER057c/UK114 family)